MSDLAQCYDDSLADGSEHTVNKQSSKFLCVLFTSVWFYLPRLAGNCL